MRVFRGLTMLLALGAILSCQAYDGASGPPSISGPPGGGGGGVNVIVGDNSYTPQTVTVGTGETVTWTWRGVNAHSVTFLSGGPGGSGVQITGTYQASFATAGKYAYSCQVHGTAMTGLVIVQ